MAGRMRERVNGKGSFAGGSMMQPETRANILRRIEALRKQMQQDGNDLEYEQHLHMVRDLESLLKKSKN